MGPRGGTFDCEFRIVRAADGETCRLHGTEKAYYEHGEPVRMVPVMRNVTEREWLVRELERSNEKLAQSAHVVSHDPQAAVRTVKSFNELLARRYRGQLDQVVEPRRNKRPSLCHGKRKEDVGPLEGGCGTILDKGLRTEAKLMVRPAQATPMDEGIGSR